MRRRFLGAALLTFASLLWLAGPTLAQPQEKGQPLSDEQFVEVVSADNLAEVDLAKLALKQSTNQDIHRFAERMIRDHTKAGKELTRMANAKSLPIATAMDKKHRQVAEKLSALQGAQFDHAYMKHMVDGHKKMIGLFEREAKNGHNPDVKEFASKTLPTLREHLQLAQKVSGAVK